MASREPNPEQVEALIRKQHDLQEQVNLLNQQSFEQERLQAEQARAEVAQEQQKTAREMMMTASAVLALSSSLLGFLGDHTSAQTAPPEPTPIVINVDQQKDLGETKLMPVDEHKQQELRGPKSGPK